MELISIDGHIEHGPELPFTIHDHSMVKIEDNAVYMIGGMW